MRRWLAGCATLALAWAAPAAAAGKATGTPPLITSDRTWPGKFYSGPDGLGAWIPDTVKVLRWQHWKHTEAPDSPGHDWSCEALSTRAMLVFLPNTPYPAATVDDFLADVMAKSGHAEIQYLPIMANLDFNGFDSDWLASNWGDRLTVVAHWGDPPVKNGVAATWLREEGSNRLADGSLGYSNPNQRPEVFHVNWGWPHGGYGLDHLFLSLSGKLARLRLPDDWDSWTPAKGRPALRPIPFNVDSEWRGDPGSIYGEWPQIYPRAQYPGNPDRGVWLIDEDYAWFWKSRSCRHPTKTMLDQGEYNNAGVVSNAHASGPPDLMITVPSRPYNNHLNGGTGFPLYPVGATIQIQVTKCLYDIDSIWIRDGSRLLGGAGRNALQLYIFNNVPLTTPGFRPLFAIARRKDGTWVTSRPSMVYVTDLIKAAPAALAPRAARAPAKPVPRRYDLRGRSLIPANGKGDPPRASAAR